MMAVPPAAPACPRWSARIRSASYCRAWSMVRVTSAPGSGRLHPTAGAGDGPATGGLRPLVGHLARRAGQEVVELELEAGDAGRPVAADGAHRRAGQVVRGPLPLELDERADAPDVELLDRVGDVVVEHAGQDHEPGVAGHLLLELGPVDLQERGQLARPPRRGRR